MVISIKNKIKNTFFGGGGEKDNVMINGNFQSKFCTLFTFCLVKMKQERKKKEENLGLVLFI